ncbi:MAG: hypothetical protein AABX82_07840 [Nanoarchaeota archaeon]
MGMRRVGTAFFAVGLGVAIVMGALSDLFIMTVITAFFWVLFGFGLIAGFLNTAKEDAEDILYTIGVLLLACIAASELSRIAPEMFGSFVAGAAKGVIAFVFPAAVVVGAKRIFDLGTGF